MVDKFCGRALSRNSCTRNRCSQAGDCKKLKKQLQMIDFSIIDTVLYLDAYPECMEALNYYHKLKAERKMVVEALSESCGLPISSFNNENTEKWLWIDGPWPWDIAAN